MKGKGDDDDKHPRGGGGGGGGEREEGIRPSGWEKGEGSRVKRRATLTFRANS